MKISIRRAKLADIDELDMLLTDLFTIEADFKPNTDKQKQGLKLLINSDTTCLLVAENNGKVIGMCSVQTLISTAEGGPVGLLEDMIIAKGYRGKGVGELLLTEMEKWSADHGLLRLQLLADKNNLPALQFYEKCFWESTSLVCWRKILHA